MWVAMSGGVDSAVAAFMVRSEGFDVTGVTMRLPQPHECEGDDPVDSAAAVCATLGVPHLVLDAREQFAEDVAGPYADAYASGLTPNPCVWCNARVKFGWLLEQALSGGASALVTGHYARIATSERRLHVARALDAGKDQSYFLYALGQRALVHSRFPLGTLSKEEVRAIAAREGLPAAERPESQEACFVGAGGTRELVCAVHPESGVPGEIVDTTGAVVGTHRGIASYTIGQRKGLGIGGLEAPLFVTAIDAEHNRIVVGGEADLAVTRVVATSAVPGFADGARVDAVVRYRMTPVAARVFHGDEGLEVRFDAPVRAVAPGQSVVCYQQDLVVAGGEIACAS